MSAASRASVLAGAALSGGAAAMLAARSLAPEALHGAGAEAMAAAVLVVLALLAAALCGYLALVWTLAALAQARRGRLTGRASLRLLRVLAPALARRVALGAATATAVGSLAIGPALAADGSAWTDGAPPVPISTEVTDAPAPPGPAPADLRHAGAAGSSGAPPAGAPLPLEQGGESPEEGGTAETSEREQAAERDPAQRTPLGWAAPAEDAPAADGATAPAPTDPAPAGEDARTVTVRPGDSLWAISDDLLGPGEDDPARIAAVWPELHRANTSVIGPDPDLIHPGQVLAVPAGITAEAAAPAPGPEHGQQEES